MDFLKESRYSVGLLQLNAYLKKFDDPMLREFASRSMEVQALARDPLKIVVAGNWNVGKSTFINALVNKEVMPTNVTKETVTINKLSYGSEYGIEIFFKKNILPPKKTLCEPEAIHRHLKDAGSQADLISYINVYYDLPELKNFTIIDTPGLNFSDKETKLSLDVIKEADVIIWLTKELAKNELIVLEKLPPDINAMVCLVNYIDMHSPSDLSDLMEDIGKRGNALFEKYFPVSAKQACEGYLAGDAKRIEDSRINEFLYWINNEIFGRHYQLIFERIKDKTIRVFGEIDEFVRQEISAAERGIESVNQAVQDITQKLQTDFSLLLSTFKSGFQKTVNKTLSDISFEKDAVKVVLSYCIATLEKKSKTPSMDGVFSAVKGELSANAFLDEMERHEADFLSGWKELGGHFREDYPDKGQILDNLDLAIRNLPPTYLYATYVCGAMHYAGMNAYLFFETHEKMKTRKDTVWNELTGTYKRLISDTAEMFGEKTLNELTLKKEKFEETREHVNELRHQYLQEGPE